MSELNSDNKHFRVKAACCSDCPCVFQSTEQLEKHQDMRTEDPTVCVGKEHGPPAVKHARMVVLQFHSLVAVCMCAYSSYSEKIS